MTNTGFVFRNVYVATIQPPKWFTPEYYSIWIDINNMTAYDTAIERWDIWETYPNMHDYLTIREIMGIYG
jgi:hypothetical protein